jgi:hypothetical protein
MYSTQNSSEIDINPSLGEQTTVKPLTAWKQFRKDRQERWLNGKSEWVLYRGEQQIGDPVFMTGAEALAKNRACDREYVRLMSMGKDVRLYTWKLRGDEIARVYRAIKKAKIGDKDIRSELEFPEPHKRFSVK